MRVAILSSRQGWHTDELLRALGERGHSGQVLPYEGLVARIRRDESSPTSPTLTSDSVSVFDADAVLARIIPNGSLEQIIFRVDVLHWLEERGIPVMNSPRAIERSVDKFYTTALLDEAGLPVPETVVCERTDEAMAAIRAMLGNGASSPRGADRARTGDVIIKPLFGSMGHGLVRVNDPEVAFRIVRSLEQVRAVFYLQRAIDHDGRDVRAFVIGGRVVGAIERVARAGEWRTNVTRGGTALPVGLSPDEEQFAIRAAAVVGADYAGVDLLRSRSGSTYVLEVNGIPGGAGLQGATGLDIAGAIVDHLMSRVSAGRPAVSGIPV